MRYVGLERIEVTVSYDAHSVRTRDGGMRVIAAEVLRDDHVAQ